MEFRNKSEKGFSLIELLVVVAIIGVLAAVGVVGYQGYIDSTKKSVTENNAKAVHQWLLNAKTIRSAGIDVDPSECNIANTPSSTSADDAAAAVGCLGGLGAEDHPFETFKNPYTQSRTGSVAVQAVSSALDIPDDGTAACSLLGAAVGDVVDGDVVVRVKDTVAHIDVYYCSKVDDNSGILTKMSNTITNF